jgi:uncharacterized protein (TIGR03083 family)
VEIAEFIESLDHQGRSLVDIAQEAGLDAVVPTCPGWRVRDLLRHTGQVHRWATGFVAEARTSHRRPEPAPELDDEALLAWCRAGHTALVEALRAAPDDLVCLTFLAAPSPRAFWARRQAHETAIHRADAAFARGTRPDDIDPDLAVDGIDELLVAFQRRSASRVRTDIPRVLRARATDTGDVWTMRLSKEPPVTTRDAAGDADCEVAGPARDLYLSFWNRLPFPSVSGDAALAELWRERSGI